MATAVAARDIKDFIFDWEGKDKSGKPAAPAPTKAKKTEKQNKK